MGNIKDENGNIVQPVEYGITPPAKIGERWSQISVKSTASISGGTFIPKTSLVEMCNKLVPLAAVYGAGLILYFYNQVKVTGVEDEKFVMSPFKLSQNYPNPFNPSTVIKYSLSAAGKTTLRIYNLLGQEVTTLVNEVQSAGEHKVEWNACGMASGVYFYRLESNGFVQVKKMILTK